MKLDISFDPHCLGSPWELMMDPLMADLEPGNIPPANICLDYHLVMKALLPSYQVCSPSR
jgi:hypothetical protein